MVKRTPASKTPQKNGKPSAGPMKLLKGIERGVATVTEAVGKIDDRLKDVEKKTADIVLAGSKREVSLPGSNDEKEKFSFLQAIRGIAYGEWGKGFEKRVFQETREKAQSAGNDTAGGFIVPTEISTELIELLREQSVVREAGARMLTGVAGIPLEIPKKTGATTGYWTGENASFTESEITFGQIKMEPHLAAGMTKLSRRFVANATPDAETLVREDLAETLQLLADLAALRGDGTLNSPVGVLNSQGVSVINGTGTAALPEPQVYEDLRGVLEDNNALRGNMAFISHPKVFRVTKLLRVEQWDGQTNQLGYVFSPPILSDEQMQSLIGDRLLRTTQLPTNNGDGTHTLLSELYFGNWNDFLFATWGSLELEASAEAGTAFQDHQVWVKAFMEMDFAVRHAESFAVHARVGTTNPLD